MRNPYFSIIVPVYKVEKYLDQCINSILSQDMKDYEIILVDDGSPDRCPEMCDYYAKSYPFIRAVHQENGGLSVARNTGMSVATGEYVLFVDSDDFWCCDDALSSIKHKLDESHADVLLFGKKKYYQLQDTYTEPQLPECSITDATCEESIKYMMENNFFVAAAWDKVIRRTLIVQNKMTFVVGQYSEDIEWCTKILMCQPYIVTLPKCIYVYRQQNGNSITANIGRKNIKCVADVIMKYSEDTANTMVLNFIAEQYVLWMTVSNYVDKAEIADLLVLMKKRWYLLNYHWYPHVKLAKKLQLLGFEGVRKLLGFYKAVKRKQQGA